MHLLRALAVALSTYSRIPMPNVAFSEENLRYSLCFFPVVGLVVGALEAGWLCLAHALGLSALFRGAVGCLIPLLVSGGIHMDGFMDTMDAVSAWQSRERRLEILKDSHTGAFAVIGCAAYLLAECAALGELPPGRVIWALTPAFVLSRALSGFFLVTFKSARTGGMLNLFKDSAQTRIVRAVLGGTTLAAALAALFIAPLPGLCALLAAALSALYYRRMAFRYFGGITGDLAGFFLQTCEVSYLLALALGGLLP